MYLFKLFRFSLGELSKNSPVLICDKRVFLWNAGPPASWKEVTGLASLEALDVAVSSILAPECSDQRDKYSRAEEQIAKILPSKSSMYSRQVLQFCMQAERYRMGKAQGAVIDGIPNYQISNRLLEALGTPAPVLIYKDFVYTPRIPLPVSIPCISISEDEFTSLFKPYVPLETVRQRYEKILASPNDSSDYTDEAELAVKAVKTAMKNPGERFGRTVVYECETTGFSVLLGSRVQPLFTLESGPWIVEDSDGCLYKFESFVVATNVDRQDSKKVSVPAVIHPPGYRHWLSEFRFGWPLHMCDYMSTKLEPLSITNTVDLLLAARHMLRAGLFGPSLGLPRLDLSFQNQMITREEAEKSGLPVYPYFRT